MEIIRLRLQGGLSFGYAEASRRRSTGQCLLGMHCQQAMRLVTGAKKEPRLAIPEFLERVEENGKDVGKLIHQPSLSDVPFELQSRFISELYANVK